MIFYHFVTSEGLLKVFAGYPWSLKVLKMLEFKGYKC